MGDSERLDDSTVGADGAQAPAEGPPSADLRSAGNDEAPKSQLSVGSEADKVRRSSIRPAPASFRPSKRDPGQLLRPAMVIHAGDVDAVVPLWDNAEPTPSHPSQPCMEAPPRVEPFALADDLARSDPRASLPGTTEPSRPEATQKAVAERAPVEAAALAVATESRASSVPAEARMLPANATGTSATGTSATGTSATGTSALATTAAGRGAKALATAALPVKAMRIQSAPPEPGAQRPLHRNTLSHFGAPNRDARSDDSTHAGSSIEGGGNGATTSPFNAAVVPNPTESVPVKGKRRTGGTIAVILSAIVLAGVFVAMMVGRSGTEPALSASTAGAVIPTLEPSAAEPAPVVNEPAPAHSVAAPIASTEEPPTAAASSGVAAVGTTPDVTSAVASAPASTSPNIVRVTLDVRPTDAKVIYQGRLQPGPPYEFEVTKGKRMALEVVRFGFATQKVVLDGRKSSVLVGLRRAAGHPAAERR